MDVFDKTLSWKEINLSRACSYEGIEGMIHHVRNTTAIMDVEDTSCSSDNDCVTNEYCETLYSIKEAPSIGCYKMRNAPFIAQYGMVGKMF